MPEEAQDNLDKANRCMKKYADQGRRPLEFAMGDKVWLKITFQIWKQITNKKVYRGLIPRFDGPFELVQRVGVMAYKLLLPERLKIHPTFHVSFLKPYYEDNTPSRVQAKKAPPTIRVQPDCEIEAILDHRTLRANKKNMHVQYLVRWKGAPKGGNSWERDTTLWQFKDIIQQYLSSLPTRLLKPSDGGGP